MMIPFKELKRRARAVLNGKYSIATSLVTTVILVSLAASYLLQHTGFLQSPQTLHRIFFWSLLAIMTLLCPLLEIGLIKFLHTLTKENSIGNPLVIIYAFQNQPDTFILTTAFRYLLIALCLLPAILRAMMMPLTTAEPLVSVDPVAILTWIVPVLVLALIGLIPAIILSLPFCLTNYVLMDDPDLSASQALFTSLKLMKGQKKRVFLLWLSFVPLFFTVLGSYGTGLLWFLPYYHATMLQLYLELTGEQPEEAQMPNNNQTVKQVPFE